MAESRTRTIQHNGRAIVLLDFSGLAGLDLWQQEVERARSFIAAHPADGTLFTLTDVSDVRYDRDIVQMVKGLAAHNKPYVRAAAVVATSAVNRSVISMVALLTKRRLQAFATRGEALDWLAKQD